MADEDRPDESPDDDQPALAPAIDPQRPRRAETKRKREQREDDEFWRGVLATPIGRRQVWNLLTSGHCFEERFACGPNGFPQPEATWHAAGEQSLVLRLYQQLLALDPLAVREMHLEHDSRFERFVDKGKR